VLKKLLLIFAGIILLGFFSRAVLAADCSGPSSSDDLDVLKAKEQECRKLLQISIDATKPSAEKMIEMENNIAAIEANVKSLSDQIDKKKKDIADDEEKLVGKKALLDVQVRDFYKNDSQSDLEYLLSTLMSGSNVSETIQLLGYRQTLINQQKQVITSIVLEVNDLAAAKKKLEDTQDWLTAEKANLEVVLAPIRDLVKRATAYQATLSATAGSLSARQQELIAAKIGSLNLSRSAGISMACSDDRNIDPGFSPRFAFYTFGIPHRVGMNQFGAYGRANYDHQGYQDILRAYYNNINFEKRSNITIKVDGYPDMPLEQYMLGIYEVPDSWPMDALKAQAVAARSYALAYTNNGANSICTTQDCQVYKGGNKGGNWEQAVKQTEREVMTNGGQAIKAWFSSTDGGYTHTSGEVFGGATDWTKNLRDTNGDVNSISDLQSKAYDRDSPCFYNAQGWRTQYNKSAWLKPEEVADVVNVILLSSSTTDWDSWDADRVKSELRSRGMTPFNQITDVSMNFDFGSGRTTSVTLSGDAGSKTFDGKTFKDYFNARAPANIAIVGPLFNIEKK